jgi:predicted alpha/beta-hydrolase family hydrolase
MPLQGTLETPGGPIPIMRYPAPKGPTLLLGHGAGAGQTHEFMVAFAEAMSSRGITAVTFDFPYMARGRTFPDRGPELEACYAAVARGVRAKFIGGRSMGGRIATQIAAQPKLCPRGLRGIVLLGYPLHPPTQPYKLRTAHFTKVKAPMLFVQGTRDRFGTPTELAPHLAGCDATIHAVKSGHTLAVTADIADTVAAWIERR